MTRARIINTGQGSISQLNFVDDTDNVVTSGRDGRLVRWTSAEEQKVIVQIDQAIEYFALVSPTRSVVFSTADGAIWHVGPHGHAQPLRSGGTRVSQIITLGNQRPILIIGYVNGNVIALDIESAKQQTLLHADGAVREITPTADSRFIAVTTNDGMLYTTKLPDNAKLLDAPWTWTTCPWRV
jgi:hypothetical protein